jgi:hypothetical protein
MNKVLAVTLVLIGTGIISETKAQTSFMASSQLPESAQQVVQPETGKQRVNTDELPKAIRQALKKNILKEWKISEAYVVAPSVLEVNPRAVYEVYLVNASHRRTVARFYENGDAVSGKK